MKKLLLLLLIIPFLSFGQNLTYVPDDNFEQALIDLGYDDVLNDSVLTSTIDTITLLPVANKNISNLIGIQNFYMLEILRCAGNQLSELNLNNNSELRRLLCGGNQLSELDLSNNSSLIVLKCGNNELINLDLSSNNSLQVLFCRNNMLTNLNIKNGNNTLLDSLFITNNPELSCIEANNVNYLNNNFSFLNGNLDSQHYFSIDCNSSTLMNNTNINKEPIQRYHILGTRPNNNKGFQLHLYDDGSVEKKYLIK